MKKITLLLSLFAVTTAIYAQKDKKMKTATPTKYTFETVENDPTGTRIYTLANGLKVYLSVYKDAPRIQTFIPVKAGSKNDPANATGLAHYLEHIMFKGTSKIGALDWEKEKHLLAEIEALYEQYRATKDEDKRKAIYSKIDSVSGVAAKFTAANEYDKLVSNLGTKGTNAYTSFEQTVYVNDIPSNQLEKWLEIESERFSEIVPRLFHTELEAVYEEKNRTLDNDFRKVFEKSFNSLFPTHQYGQQTTIGTIDHLKNPSITEIKNYFGKYYVPNNMAICLSGDLDPDKTIELVDKYWGKFEKKAVAPFQVIQEEPLKENKELEIFGPDAENLMLAYRLPSKKHADIPALKLMNQMLYNGQAGLIDVNLNQKQLVLEANSFQYLLNDYSTQIFFANAREGQKLTEAKDLLLGQIELLKKGQFEEWMLEAAINNYRINEMRMMESNRGRANAMVDAFTSDIAWKDKIGELERLKKVTKADIIAVANKYFTNYVCVYKRFGQDPNKMQVDKPQITKVEVNRDKTSAFYKSLEAKPSMTMSPVFVDYTKVDKKNISGFNFLYKKNTDNSIFDLYYLIDLGKNYDPKLGMAINYLQYLGTDKYSLEELNKEFYKLGAQYYVYASEDQVYVRLSGLQDKFEQAVQLFEELLNNPKGDAEALKNLVDGEKKRRADAKMDKSVILSEGLISYAIFGEKNPFNNVLSDNELSGLTVESMLSTIKNAFSFQHSVLYYGPLELASIEKSITTLHKVNGSLKPLPTDDKFVQKDITEPTVYWVNYDMVQAEVLMVSKSEKYNKANVPVVTLYNEYFGGGMGSIVFQELRESKALAYSVWSAYRLPSKKEKSAILMSYIGTQVDKLPEAMVGMVDLLNNMPESELAFNNAKKAIKNKIETERITKAGILFDYLKAQKLGLEYDVRKDVYEKVPSMDFNTIKSFQQNMVKSQPKNIVVIGNKDNLDFKTLSNYGKVQELSLEQVFGY